MILRAVCLAILILATAGWDHAREPIFQLAQNAEGSGKAANVVEPADREMMIGRFNMDKHNYTGAINRFKTVVTQYPTSAFVEEALARLVETYLSIGIIQEAQCAAAVLQRKFPDGPWSHQALDALKSNGLEPAENPKSWIPRAFIEIPL
jgi:outer membrane protein assembly factor BamD